MVEPINLKNMKRIYILWLLLVLTGCIDDIGNYEYRELNDLVIEEFRDDYVVEQFTRFQLTPVIQATGQFDPEQYEYIWILYGVGWDNTADTLSYAKDLDVEITSTPAEYALYLSVKDKHTGVEYTQQTFITVINSYTIGLLTLSRVGDEANLTFLNIANSLIEDAYQKVNGQIAGRNPTKAQLVFSGTVSFSFCL